jgi:class 3 adenylate cyclase/ligand-binding sensor domain-containing protein/predicted metal-dependent HD superfamily phosphohydrolase
MVKKALLFFIAILSFGIQAKAINYDLVKCDQYTIEDGLPQSYIETIYQDDGGYLWIATQDGISKFNGYEFKNYFFDPYNRKSLASNYALEIKPWGEDTICFTTALGFSLLVLKTNEFKNYCFNKLIPEIGSVNTCVILDDNNILIGSQGGLYIAHIDDSLTVDDIALVDEKIITKTLYKFKETVLFTHDKILYKFEEGNIKKVKEFEKEILNFFVDQTGFCLVFSNQLLRFSDLNITPEIFEIPSKVTSCLQLKDELWLGTIDEGIIIYRSEKDKPIQWFKNQNSNNSLLSNKIKCIYKDDFGVIWIGTDKGLNKIDPSKQQFLHLKASSYSNLADNNCWSFYETDSLFISGYSNGIQIQNKLSHNYEWVPFDGYVLDFQEYNDQLLVATSKGVFSLEREDSVYHLDSTIIKLDSNNVEPEIIFDFELSNDNLLIGAVNGIGVLNKQLELIKHLPLKNVRSFIKKYDGIYFIASPTGVYKLTNLNSPSTISYESDLIVPISELQSLCLEKVGSNLWIGLYGGGLVKYDLNTKKTKHYSTQNGLPNNSIYSIVSDNNGYLWLSTNGGLSKFNYTTEKFYNYNTNDGIQSLEFNSGADLRASNNKLYFGGINGYNIVNTSQTVTNIVAPKVHISSVLYNGVNLLNPEESDVRLDQNNLIIVTIPYNKNSFTIHVDGIHFSSPEENSFSYQLEGYQSEAIEVKNKRNFSFHNLKVGDYYFKVRAANSDSKWSEVKKIHIIIKPPFYLSWWFITGAILVGSLILFLIIYSRVTMARRQRTVLERKVRERTREVEKQKSILEEQKNLIEAEKNKEEELLLNVLPRETARELMSTGRSTPKHYEVATVMFADFKNFTKITENLGPKELVAELDDSFAKFDDIVGRFNVEKIKTSGDAYMCVGGVPIRNRTNAVDCVLTAFYFQKYMEEKRNIREGTGKPQWHLRIGLHTGELVAGVVGKKKFLYDVWGDTVNTAARMETSSDPGKVNISGTTYEYIKDYFDCEYRGNLPVKNKGAIDMYYVKRIKEELSDDEAGLMPNKKFFELLNFKVYSQRNYEKVKDVIVNKLKQELPNDLYYHGPHHTLDVIDAAERIGKSEGLNEEEIMLIKLAALFHDSGFLNKYQNNEVEGAKFAKEFLPKYGFTDQQVDLVEGMILATVIPQKPTNHLEEIICDADLDYLGRSKEEFDKISGSLAKELVKYKFLKSTADWDPIQVKFLESHRYFTETCKKVRRSGKIQRLREIHDRISGPTA